MCDTQILLLFLFCSIVIVFLFSSSKKVSNIQLNFVTIILIIIAVSRDAHVADYTGYYKDFISINKPLSEYEPTFSLIKGIASNTLAPAFFGFLIYAFISIYFRLRMVKKLSPLWWGSILVYITNVYVAQDLIAIRAACATAFSLYIIYYKLKNDWKKALIFLFIASCFHYSAVLYVLILFISTKKSFRWIYLGLLAGCYILSYYEFTFSYLFGLISNPIVENLYNHHKYTDPINIFNLLQIGRIFICLTGWLFLNRIKKKDERIVVYLKMYTIGISLFVLFSDLTTVALRFSDLFMSIDILLIPVLITGLFKNGLLSKVIIVIYSVVLFYFTINEPTYFLNL